jgi:cytochrome P450
MECPHERLLELALKYGGIVMLDYTTERVVLLAKPEYIEHVLHQRHQTYDKQTFRWKCVRQIWGTGLLTSDGDEWRRQRQRMQPAFHQTAMPVFAARVAEEAQRIAAMWAMSAVRHEPRDVYRDMLACAMRAITRTAFGSDLHDRTKEISDALDHVQHYVNPMAPMNLLRVPLWVQRAINPAYRRFQEAFAEIDRILDDIVRARLAGAPDRTDLLGMIMYARDDETGTAMSAAQLHDEMVNILMAGHETTAIAASWCWYLLAQFPSIEAQLHAELDRVLGGRLPAYEDVAELSYTKQVFQEAMRLYPPTWAVDRRAREDDTIDGYRIRRGTKVAISPYVMHHHPGYWDNPAEFRPERFSTDEVAARPPYAYLPFGGGPRRCVGMRFAMLEGPLILATLAQSFSVRLEPGQQIVPEARLNFPPRHGIRMHLEPRAVPAAARSATAY